MTQVFKIAARLVRPLIAASGLISGSRIFHSLVAAAIIASFMAATLPPGHAHSPEDAVAFFMWGLEKTTRASQLNPSKWAVEDRNGATSAFVIRRVSECRYDIQIEKQLATGDALRFDYSLDFSAVTEYEAWVANAGSRAIIIKIEGTRWYSKKVTDLKNGRVLQTIKDGVVDANVATGGSVERLRRAFADFRINHCRGRAS
jgi:hypothetical protein